MDHQDKLILRARDFWGALVLTGISLFFLWRTTSIPLWGENRAGVSGSDWYNSAAIVPYGIFVGMLILSVIMLVISIRSGGAQQALSSVGIGWNREEAGRFGSLGLILFFYIAGLMPRVDFILGSGLLISALIFGFHGGYVIRRIIATAAVSLAGLTALIRHLPQSEWNKHGDDWVTLVVWIALTAISLFIARDRVGRITPVIAVLAPTILVCAMAFGFRQNVPARGGLIFKQIEFHYYVTLKPLWSR